MIKPCLTTPTVNVTRVEAAVLPCVMNSQLQVNCTSGVHDATSG
jgi:hypothetical protein